MRYTKFEFENFKGIERMSIALDGDVTTLIGLNESGKTTILEAMFCFSYGAENLDVLDPAMASLRDPEQWVPIALRANFNGQITIAATVELSSDDKDRYREHMQEKFNIHLSDIPSSIRVEGVYRFKNSKFETDTVKSKLWTINFAGATDPDSPASFFDADTSEWQGAVKYLASQLPRIWYFPNFLFELPERFILSGGAEATPEERDKNLFYRTTFEKVISELGINAELDTHVVDRLRSSDATDNRSLKSVLLSMSRLVSQTILDGWNSIFGSAPAGQEVEIGADLDESGDPYLVLQIKGADGYYDLSERSLGFRWFFMFLLLTSYHGSIAKDGSRPLFLLDEPASNLHSSAQAELLKSFRSLAQSCYLVYTTHSQHLINVAWLNSAYVVKNEALGSLTLDDYMASRIGSKTNISAMVYRKFVNDNPSDTSYFQPVLDLLEYRPADLEPVPDVVLVEGKSDYYLLRYAIDVLRLESDLRFVPGMGAGALAPLIRLHIAWGKSFVVLLDGDAEGLKQKARYESEFGPMLANRCFLLPDLCGDPGAKEAESLLTKTDHELMLSEAGLVAGARGPTKKQIQQATMELFAARKHVAIDNASVGRLRSLLKAISIALSADV